MQRLRLREDKPCVRCLALAHIEAFIDFSEDDNVEEGVLLAGQKPTAIVSAIPGTTRDVVEAALNIGGYPVILSDTAGLRDSEDPIEKEGVRRAKARVGEADVIVAVIDVSDGLLSREAPLAHLQNLFSSLQGDGHRSVVVALNKVDLLSQESIVGIKQLYQESGLPPVCLLSCHTGEGIGNFLRVLRDRLKAICGDPLQGAPTITQTRHRHHLTACHNALGRYSGHRQLDLVLSAEELRIAHRQLGAITGRVSTEEILDIIFSDFCIGK
ncbi:hypothetical protein GDO78_006725 [Eleutherodactylus coqui]|uniref:Mitochondrial GTPase n=1 Tax=Eleutherodactylus coqui TaxID=57060 RepID=A0A8J6FH35_ELECQ|nr:hypothetical protein GDO78_006725 [Eleutherodactylus coqui]